MKGEVDVNPLHLNMLVGGCGRGRNRRDRAGGRLLMGGKGKVSIETSKAIPTHGGASRAILQKLAQVTEEQEKCTHLEEVEHFSEFLSTS